MKSVFEMIIHGGSDVNVGGVMFEHAEFHFRSFNIKKMIEILDSFDVEPITSEVWDKQTAGFFRKSIEDMKNFLATQSPIHLFQEFGDNQYVRVERIVIPTEEDFVD